MRRHHSELSCRLEQRKSLALDFLVAAGATDGLLTGNGTFYNECVQSGHQNWITDGGGRSSRSDRTERRPSWVRETSRTGC